MATIKDGWVYVTFKEACDVFVEKQKGDEFISDRGGDAWIAFSSDLTNKWKRYDTSDEYGGYEAASFRRPLKKCTPEQLALLSGAPTLSDHFI
jgi:hypothetical protein